MATPAKRQAEVATVSPEGIATAIDSKKSKSAMTRVCMDCKEEKERSGFYKQQWKLAGKDNGCGEESGGRCKPCHEAAITLKNKEASETKKRQAKKERKKAKKKAKKEVIITEDMICPDCGTACRLKPLFKLPTCRDCYSKERYLNCGIPYEAVRLSELDLAPLQKLTDIASFTSSRSANEEMIELDLIFHQSFQDSGPFALAGFEHEDIHRTATGRLCLGNILYREHPTIVGGIQVEEPYKLCENGFECSFLNTATDAKLAEDDHPQEETSSLENNIFGRKIDHTDRKWFSGGVVFDRAFTAMLPNCVVGDMWVLQEDYPLLLQPDYFGISTCFSTKKVFDAEEDSRVIGIRVIDHQRLRQYGSLLRHPFSKKGRQQGAKDLMLSHQEGHDSWMQNHLLVPPSVAARIRSFLMPPPIFYLKRGDVIVFLQDLKFAKHGFDWKRVLVFRTPETE